MATEMNGMVDCYRKFRIHFGTVCVFIVMRILTNN